MKTYSKRPAPNDSWRETKRRSNRPKSTAREEPREEPEEELERESEEEPEGEPRDGSPRPIITSVASRPPNKGQRVFMYDLGAGKQPFILHCPTPNCKFVFSRGLTKYGLVVQHFDECGVPHNGVKDIVTRLARPGEFLHVMQYPTALPPRYKTFGNAADGLPGDRGACYCPGAPSTVSHDTAPPGGA